MTTSYSIPPTAVAFLAVLGVHVSSVSFVPGQCEWCGEADRVASVRVYGDPPLEPLFGDPDPPLDVVEVCVVCAPGLIERALSELDPRSRRGVRVEVAA